METNFTNVVSATGKNFEIEQSISGYYRLMLNGKPVLDMPFCEDVNNTYEEAESYFMDYLLEHEVPEDKKTLRGGFVYFLK